MDTDHRIRLLEPGDLPFADTVRELAGWNQTIGDWQRMLSVDPAGCFLAEWNGVPAGTATTTIYSPELAWIGMVLVHPDYRRRGIGRALLEHCICHLRARGVRCIKLDATPLGRTLYEDLGFQHEWRLRRWVGRLRHPLVEPSKAQLRPWRKSETTSVALLDTPAFGAPRGRLLGGLAEQSCAAYVLETGPGDVAAYGLLRRGARTAYLGPVVASTAEAGRCVLRALLSGCVGQVICWDIPDPNHAAVAVAEELGFRIERPLTRMYLGENLAPGDPQRQFGLAGPEIG